MKYIAMSRAHISMVTLFMLAVMCCVAAYAYEPISTSLPVPCPPGGIQLLGPDDHCEFVGLDGGPHNWDLTDNVLTVTLRKPTAKPNHIVSKLHFRDADIHVEFLLPKGSNGNSGLYLHGMYELQILNSFGKSAKTAKKMGALYLFYPPLVNASRPPMEWQAYDLRFFPPRRDTSGTATKPGVVTAWLNGKLVQDRATFLEPRSKHCPLQSNATPFLNAMNDQVRAIEQGPLFLQEHGSPVRFRNIWVKPLDGRVSSVDPSEAPKLTIGLIGDATVATTCGWGPAFADLLFDEARVINYAEDGATLESLTTKLDGLLEWSPHYVFVHFGINDQKAHSTKAYRDRLRSYAVRIREAGAKAIIISPVSESGVDDQSKISPFARTDSRTAACGALSGYSREAAEVAKESEAVFIDLQTLSVEHANKIDRKVSGTYSHGEMGATCFGEIGAVATANLLLDEVRKTVPELARGDAGERPANSAGRHLFILAGQSNMAQLNLEESFAPIVSAAFGEENVIVVKDAVAGQPIRRWYMNWRSKAGDTLGETGDLYERLMTKVSGAAKGHILKSVTFVWMQGERDAREQYGEVYADSLRGLFEQVAAEFDGQHVNFVIGRLSDFDLANRRYPHWTLVRRSQIEVAEDFPRAAWVDTDDLNDGLSRSGEIIENGLHYSAAGYKLFGQRLAEQAIELINAEH